MTKSKKRSKATTPPPPKLTPEKIEELLRRGAADAKALDKQLKRVFTLGEKQRNLVLD